MSPSDLPPRAPGALPVLGHLPALARNPLGFLSALRTHGPVLELSLVGRPAYVINTPPLVRDMLVNGRAHVDKGGPFYEAVAKLLGEGLATSKADKHRVHRPLVQPAFQHRRMPSYASRMHECALQMISTWAPGRPVDIDAEASRFAAACMASTLFLNPRSRSAVNLVQQCLPALLSGLFTRMLVPAAARIPTPANRRFQQAISSIHNALDQLIQEQRTDGDDHGDILSLLTAPAPDGQPRLSDADIRDHIISFFSAGIETTAAVVSWTLHILSTRPELSHRIRDEIDTVLRGRPATYDDLRRLPHLQRLLTEVLRLYPPAWIMSRITTAPTSIGNYVLPAGVDLLYSTWALHRDPSTFPSPDTCDPDRWIAPTRTQRDALLAFGTGPRRCIGDTFGTMEATIAIATIVQRFTFQPAPGIRVTPHPRITLHPKGLHLLTTARSPAP